MMTFHRLAALSTLLPIVLLLAGPAEAAGSNARSRPLAIGIGAGVVDNGNDEEPYLTANFRFPLRRGQGKGGVFRAYLEPEIGIWDFSNPFGSDDSLDGEVLNVGVNVLALARGRRVESWVGIGVGAYFEDVQVIGGNVGTVLDQSETNIGGNLQVGIDINFTSRFGIFGVGRIDYVDTEFFDEQQKLYFGLRFRFGR